MKREILAYKKWGEPLDIYQKTQLMKEFLIIAGFEKSIVDKITNLFECRDFIVNNAINNKKLLDNAIKYINAEEYTQVRANIVQIFEVQPKTKELFTTLALKFEAYGYDENWPSYMMNSQTSIASTLSKITLHNDKECFHKYMNICKNMSLSYARVPLIWELTKFKKFSGDIETAIKELYLDETIRLALLHTIEKFSFTSMLPILIRYRGAGDELYQRELVKVINKLQSIKS